VPGPRVCDSQLRGWLKGDGEIRGCRVKELRCLGFSECCGSQTRAPPDRESATRSTLPSPTVGRNQQRPDSQSFQHKNTKAYGTVRVFRIHSRFSSCLRDPTAAGHRPALRRTASLRLAARCHPRPLGGTSSALTPKASSTKTRKPMEQCAFSGSIQSSQATSVIPTLRVTDPRSAGPPFAGESRISKIIPGPGERDP